MVTEDDLIGKTVLDATGNHVGDVHHIDIEVNTWKVNDLYVKLSDKAAKDLGLKKTLKSSNLRISTSYIGSIDVIIRLNLSLSDLKKSL